MSCSSVCRLQNRAVDSALVRDCHDLSRRIFFEILLVTCAPIRSADLVELECVADSIGLCNTLIARGSHSSLCLGCKG